MTKKQKKANVKVLYLNKVISLNDRLSETITHAMVTYISMLLNFIDKTHEQIIISTVSTHFHGIINDYLAAVSIFGNCLLYILTIDL